MHTHICIAFKLKHSAEGNKAGVYAELISVAVATFKIQDVKATEI